MASIPFAHVPTHPLHPNHQPRFRPCEPDDDGGGGDSTPLS